MQLTDVIIKPPEAPWFYDDLSKDFREDAPVWREVSEKDYYYMLDVLPPLYVRGTGAFLVSEPYCDTNEGTIYACAVELDFRYYARLIPRPLASIAVSGLTSAVKR